MRNFLLRWIAGGSVERRQRLRLRRFFMSFASYLMWYLIAIACWEAGLIEAPGAVLVLSGAGIFLTQLIFYVLIRSGGNLRFRDPSLTVPQIVVALGWALLLIAVSREIRGVMLTVYMVTLLFGIFALDKRRFMLTGLAAFAGYAVLVLLESARGMNYFSDGYYIVSVVVLGGVLLWTAMFGSYVSDLRYRLQARNEELEKVLVQMRELADRDDLTGLYNRRVIMDALRKLKARADRTHEPFSVCIVDLDHFKAVNDEYGHLTGDRVLAEFSAAMSQALRGMDFFARSDPAFGRYGGEEFILLLPGADIEGARACAERLRKCQEARSSGREAASPSCTLSAGIAEYVYDEDIESLLRRADRALYAAKHDGRNRVRAAET
ncbi:MAG TPA: GGDEF domain-containing protein [Gammaproteobacteria bacterium]